MKKLGMIAGASALLVLGIVLGAFFAGPLLASASSTSTASTSSQHTSITAASTPSADTISQYCNDYMTSLAKRLNISADTLNKAQQGALEDVLAKLVKDGKLTQAQADKLKTHIADVAQCNFKDLGKGTNSGKQVNMQNLQKYMTVIANDVSRDLHLSTTDLQAKLQSGQTLSAIAKAQGVSETALQTSVKNAIQDALKQAVANGDLTQAQADQFSQQFASNPQFVEKMLNRPFKQGAPGMAPTNQ